MKKLKKKIYILVLFICLLLITSFFCSQWTWYERIFLYRVGSCIELYICDNHGNWPASKNDLISQGYIELIQQGSGKSYKIKMLRDYMDEWHSDLSLPKHGFKIAEVRFDRYSIKYGIKVEGLRVENNKLINTQTGSSVLLIEGPFKFLLKSEYRKVSLDLYKLMLEKSKSIQTDANEIAE